MGRVARKLDRAKGYLEEIESGQIESVVRAITILLLLFAVFHLSELSNFTLSIDDEFAAFREDAAAWLSQGRWTAFLFQQFVLRQPILPFLPIALFGLFCSIGYLLFLRAIGEARPDPLSFAFFPLFVAFPTWAFLTAFQSNTPAAGLGVFFSCWTAVLFRKDREQVVGAGSRVRAVWRIAIAGLVGSVAIGCYQSFSLFIAVALLASIISMSLAGRPATLVLKDCLAAIAVLGFSLVLYALILKLFLGLFQKRVSGYIPGYIHIQSYVRLEDLLDQPRRVVSEVLSQMMDVYFGRQSVYGYESPVIIVLMVLAAAGVVHSARRIAGNRGGFVAGLTILALLTAPFGMNLMSGGSVPPRSLVAVPVALASLGLLGFKYGPRWLSRIGVIVLLLLYFCMFKSLSGFNAARELVQLHDRQLALVLSQRIASVAGPTEPGKPLTLDVFGYQPFQTPYPKIAQSTIGASFFEWDGGDPYRIRDYMRLVGVPPFNVVAPERRLKLLDEFVVMPAWPAAGSVRAAADGTILVKLGDEPNLYYRQALVGMDSSAKVDDKPFYRLSEAVEGSWSVENASPLDAGREGIALDTNNDPQFIFKTGASRTVENCSRIELRTRLRFERPTGVQIFYKKPRQTEFVGAMSTDTRISPAGDGGFVDVYLQMISRDGFADSFRLDPVDGYQRVTIGEMELFCRIEKAP